MARLRCVVPFCRRTRGDRKGDPVRDGMEWICGEHWRLVSRALKHRKKMSERAATRADERFNAAYMSQGCAWTEAQLARALAARDLASKIWARCKRQAIEIAMGIRG